MRRQNADIVRRASEAAIGRPRPDFAAINDLYHPDVEIVRRGIDAMMRNMAPPCGSPRDQPL